MNVNKLLLVIATGFSLQSAQAQQPANPHTRQPTASSLTNRVSITIEGDHRVIRANGLPDHTPGRFPNRDNPNTIAAQTYNFRVPANPKPAAKPTPFALGIFGIAVNGVVFDPGANEWWNNDRNSGWQYEPLTSSRSLGIDQNNAHVQPTGAYHYHGIPTGMLAKTKGAKEHMVLLGWAADGFPIYAPWGYSDPKNSQSPLKPLKPSYRIRQGNRPGGPGGAYDGSFVKDYEYVAGAGDLDECNGRFGITPEFPQGTYHYYVTSRFPFIPRMFLGTPDASFLRRGPPGGPGGPGGFGGPGQNGGRPPGGRPPQGFPPPQ